MIYNFDDLEFSILTVDRFLHKNGTFDVGPRPYAALSFRTSGTSEFEIANKSISTKQGNLLFIPANMPYKVNYSSSESIVVHLERCNYYEAESAAFQNAAAIERRFLHLLESWNERHSVNQAKSILYDIFETISDDQKISIDDTNFANCIRYIDAHFCDSRLDMQNVCEYGFISMSSLQRGFKKYLGVSPKQYLIKLRMNKALELLRENKLSVKEIAFACGYEDKKYFSRIFKKKYGYPPSELHNKIIV